MDDPLELSQPGSPPDLLTILGLRASATVLTENLQEVLTALTAHRLLSPAEIKEIYDTVYLPRAAALADGLASLHLPGHGPLREPLHPAAAESQLLTLLGVLNEVVAELNKINL